MKEKRTSEEKVTSKSDRVSTFYNKNIFLKLAFFPFFLKQKIFRLLCIPEYCSVFVSKI